jgi:hypothetical protein
LVVNYAFFCVSLTGSSESFLISLERESGAVSSSTQLKIKYMKIYLNTKAKKIKIGLFDLKKLVLPKSFLIDRFI